MKAWRLLKQGLLFYVLFTIAACGDQQGSYLSPPADANTIRVGVILGSTEEQLLAAVKKIAEKKYDLEIKVKSYLYVKELNKALANNEIDANIFQHQAYLDYSQRKYGYRIVSLGDTYIYPMGIYSKKINNILQVKEGALVAIPEEPTNETRALRLLEKTGLIRMSSREDIMAGVDDIAANSRQLQFKKFPANQLPNVLATVDIAVINAGFALSMGEATGQYLLAVENQNSAYANLIVGRQEQARDPRLKALIVIFRSAEIQQVVNEIFHGIAIRAW